MAVFVEASFYEREVVLGVVRTYIQDVSGRFTIDISSGIAKMPATAG